MNDKIKRNKEIYELIDKLHSLINDSLENDGYIDEYTNRKQSFIKTNDSRCEAIYFIRNGRVSLLEPHSNKHEYSFYTIGFNGYWSMGGTMIIKEFGEK